MPTNFKPTTPFMYAPGRVIREGNSGSLFGELDLLRNGHFLHGTTMPPIVHTPFNSDAGYVAGASTVYAVRGVWRRRVFRDLSQWNCVVTYENTSGADAGKVKFELQSDASKNMEITLAAGSGKWTVGASRFTYDPAVGGGRDNIVMSLKNGTTGECRIRAVDIYPWELATVAAGKTAEGMVPLDTLESSADDALSLHLRQTMLANNEVLRKTRADTLLGWCEDPAIRTPSTYACYKRVSSTYKTMIIVPFRAKRGQTSVEWAVAGYRDGASGSIKVRTMMGDTELDSAEQALGAAWASPYNSQWYDDGGSTLTCIPDAWQRLEVQLKGDGASNAYLMGACAWMANIT